MSAPDHEEDNGNSFSHPSNHHVHPEAVEDFGHNDGQDLEGEYSVVPEDATQDEIDEQAHHVARMSNLGQQIILLPEKASKADAIEVLATKIPQNEYGLPVFFYRSDLLPFELNSLTQDEADAAAVVLDYSLGYPTFNKGQIFWYQLPHEPMNEFFIFQKFLNQAASKGLRQLQLLSMDENVSLGRIYDLAREYFWNERARAYDIFQVAADRKKRELRSRRVQDDHFDLAHQLLTQIKSKFDDPDWINSLSPQDAINALMDLVKIQRISSGLSTTGVGNSNQIDPIGAASGHDMLSEITKGFSQGEGGLGVDNNLKALLADPRFALEAQSLVIRVRSNHEGTDTPTLRAGTFA